MAKTSDEKQQSFNLFFLNHSLWVNLSGNSVDVIDYTKLITLVRWSSLGTLITTGGVIVKDIVIPAKLDFPNKTENMIWYTGSYW